MKIHNLIDIANPKIVDLKSLKNHPKNPRKQTDKGMALLRKSVEELGAFRPLIVNNKNQILAGNQLFSILKERGVKAHPCIFPVKDLTDEQEKKIIVMDNSNSFNEASNDFDIDMIEENYGDILKDFNVSLDDIKIDIQDEEEEESDDLRSSDESLLAEIKIQCLTKDRKEIQEWLETKIRHETTYEVKFK